MSYRRVCRWSAFGRGGRSSTKVAAACPEPGVVSDLPEVVTVGVYGSSLETFLDALARERVSAVFDIRQRRGVRGPEYTWANAQRLQRALATAGIAYEHRKELAPTTELRHLQYAADDRQGIGKRARRSLDPEYRTRYIHEILDRVDLADVVAAMPVNGATALLCVEAEPAACHRLDRGRATRDPPRRRASAGSASARRCLRRGCRGQTTTRRPRSKRR